MFEKVLPKPGRELLRKLTETGQTASFYLAGGTAAALQLGYRLSEDLDFFSPDPFEPIKLEANLRRLGEVRVANQERGTLSVRLMGVKVSWMEYPYPLLAPTLDWQGISIAGLPDIGMMKLIALAQRGSRRDFVDLYVICKHLSGLDSLIAALPQKYPGVNYNLAHLLKSLAFFDDAEVEPEPRMLRDLSWDVVKKFFRAEAHRLAGAELGI